MTNFNRLYENQLMEFFANMQAFNRLAVINLGGASGPGGGSGGPPGGFIGMLPQTRVAFDTTESSSDYFPPSGASLLHNLNRIRHRITVIEDEKTTHQTILTFTGTLLVSNNPLRIYNNFGVDQTITEVFLSVSDSPVGSNIIVDVHKNGTTIFTNQSNRPQITADGSTTGYSTSIDVPTWADGQYLTAHIDQIGSTTPGSNLVVHIIHQG